MTENHRLLFEKIANSTELVAVFDLKSCFSVKANYGSYPNLTLCDSVVNEESIEGYLDAVENFEASSYILIENDAVAQILKKRGFRAIEKWTSMSISTNDLAINQNTELECVKITTNEQLLQWLAIVEICLFNESKLDQRIFEGLLKSDNITLWIGIYRGIPVCTALSLIDNQEVGLYMCATLPEFRRRGYANQLVKHCLIDASTVGVTVGLIQSTRMGLEMYRKIGFREIATSTIYWKVGKQYI